MNKKEFATFAAALQTFFPRYNLLPNREAMELWYMELKDISGELLTAALRKWVVTEKWPPSIAELRELCSEISEGKLPDWGDAWSEVSYAVRRYGFMRPEEAIESMSPATQAAVRRIGWTQICESENQDTLRAQFRQVFEIVSKREIEDRKLPQELKTEIERLQIGSGQTVKALLESRGLEP